MGNWPVKENKATYAAYHGLVHIDKHSEPQYGVHKMRAEYR